ncbi:uncharacterized protein CLUP02_05488, partial [Colletotrichum lupini]
VLRPAEGFLGSLRALGRSSGLQRGVTCCGLESREARWHGMWKIVPLLGALFKLTPVTALGPRTESQTPRREPLRPRPLPTSLLLPEMVVILPLPSQKGPIRSLGRLRGRKLGVPGELTAASGVCPVVARS